MTRSFAPSRPVRTLRPFAFALLALFAACGDEGGAEPAAVADDLDGVVSERVGDYVHVLADLDYDRPAPSGGDHPPSPYWLTCGVYEGSVPDELAVHSLEHGAVWIALGAQSTDDDREAAEQLADGAKVIVSDVDDLPQAVEVVAWGLRLPLDTATGGRAAAFVQAFVDAPTAPEAGASCSSVGDPPSPPTLPA